MTNKINIIKYCKISITIATIILAIAFAVGGYLQDAFRSGDAFTIYIKQFGIMAPIVFIAFQAIQVIIPIIPSFLGYACGTALFGIWGGFACNYAGICIGSLLAFLLARKYGTVFVKSIIKEKNYDKCVAWINKKKSFPIALFAAILLPLAPDDALCYLSGLTKLKFSNFTWIILLGKPWCILAYSFGFGLLLQ